MQEKRIMYIEVSREFLIEPFKKEEVHWKIADNKIPEDARVVGIEYIADIDCFKIVIESSTFNIVSEGASVPRFPSTVFEDC